MYELMFPVLRVVKAGIWGFWFLILAIPSRTWQRCPSRAQHPRRLVKWWECCVRLLRPSNVSSTKSWPLVESSLPIKRPLCIRSYHPKGCLKLSNPTPPCPLSEDHENTVSWEWEQCIHKILISINLSLRQILEHIDCYSKSLLFT